MSQNLELLKQRDELVIKRQQLDEQARRTLGELQVAFNEAREALIKARSEYTTAKTKFGSEDRAIERQLLELERQLHP